MIVTNGEPCSKEILVLGLNNCTTSLLRKLTIRALNYSALWLKLRDLIQRAMPLLATTRATASMAMAWADVSRNFCARRSALMEST